MQECAGGPPGALGARPRLSRLWCPPPGAAPPPGGRGAAVSPAGLRPPMDWGGGGEGGVLWSPDAAPRRPRGGGLLALALEGPLPGGGAHSSPASLYPLGAGPSCRPSLGHPAPLGVAARCRLAGGGGGECWGRRLGSAVGG